MLVSLEKIYRETREVLDRNPEWDTVKEKRLNEIERRKVEILANKAKIREIDKKRQEIKAELAGEEYERKIDEIERRRFLAKQKGDKKGMKRAEEEIAKLNKEYRRGIGPILG